MDWDAPSEKPRDKVSRVLTTPELSWARYGTSILVGTVVAATIIALLFVPAV